MNFLQVAGIDPSLRNTGMAGGRYDLDTDTLDIETLMLIETEKQSGKAIRVNSDDLRCCGVITAGIHKWIGMSDIVFAEIPSGGQSASAAKALGMATAILGGIGAVGTFKGKLIQVTASEVKFLATGSKNASKEEMIEWAATKWPDAGWLTTGKDKRILKKNEHLADACGAIHAGIQTDQFKTLVQMMRSLIVKN